MIIQRRFQKGFICVPNKSTGLNLSQFSVFTQRLLALLAVIKHGALPGFVPISIGNHHFHLDTECCSCQPHYWRATVTRYFVLQHYGNSFADEAILSLHVIMSNLLWCPCGTIRTRDKPVLQPPKSHQLTTRSLMENPQLFVTIVEITHSHSCFNNMTLWS